LSQREKAICSRLREAREWLEKSQQACARQIGLDRATFVNYEVGRTPLRFEVALRFCRQMIVSEEWLATGRFEASWNSATQHRIKRGNPEEERAFEAKILRRQCVDLLSEPEALHIPPGTLFSDAYDKHLAPRFAQLVTQFFFRPRICLTQADHPEIALNLLTALNERYFHMLANEAARLKGNYSDLWRGFTRCQYEAGDLIFRKFMGFPSNSAQLASLDWLRYATTEPGATLGPLHGQVEPAPSPPPVSTGRISQAAPLLKK